MQSDIHHRNVDANALNQVKGDRGEVYWVHAINLTASVAYLHFYDALSANVTEGSTTPDLTFAIPTQGDTNGAGFTLHLGRHLFINGITTSVTTNADGSTGDPGTVVLNLGYS